VVVDVVEVVEVVDVDDVEVLDVEPEGVVVDVEVGASVVVVAWSGSVVVVDEDAAHPSGTEVGVLVAGAGSASSAASPPSTVLV